MSSTPREEFIAAIGANQQDWVKQGARCAISDLDGDGRADIACTSNETGAIMLHVAVLIAYGITAYWIALVLTRRRLLK